MSKGISTISGREPARGRLDPVVPLHQQLSNHIRRSIRSGKHKAGEKIATEAELIETYGVSRITVRRALQDLASDGYLIGIKGKGTFVNPSLFTAVDTYLFVHAIETGLPYPFTSALLGGICGQNTDQIGFRLEMLAYPPRNLQASDDRRVEDLVCRTQIDGVLTLPRLRQDTLEYLVRRKIPVVQLGLSEPTPLPGVVAIYTPREKGDVVMIDHLIQRGWRRIGYVAEPTIEGPDAHRRQIRQHLATFGLPFVDEAFEVAMWGINGGMEAARRLLDRLPELDAIVAADDLQAVGVMHAVVQAGRTVGKDIAVAGTGDFLGEHSHCGLTTVGPAVSKRGELATQCLRDLIRGKTVPPVIEIMPEVVVRDST